MAEPRPMRIVLVDDDPGDRALVAHHLRTRFPEVETPEVDGPEAWRRVLAGDPPAAVVTDYRIGWTDGLRVLDEARAAWPGCPVVMYTGTGSEAVAAEGMKRGLSDYVVKGPEEGVRLALVVDAAIEDAARRRALRRAEDLLRFQSDLLAGVTDAVLATGPDLRITYWNPGAERIYGRPAAEALGRELPETLGTEMSEEELAGHMARLRAGEQVRSRSFHRRADGTRILVETLSFGVFGADGTLAGFAGVNRDLTRQAESDRALAEAELRFRRTVEQVPAMIYVRDPDSGQTRYASPQAETLSGFPAQAWVDDPRLPARLVHPEDREGVAAAYRAMLTTGQPFEAEYRLFTRSGELRWIQDRATLLRSGDRAVAVQGVMVDVTERRRMSEALRESEARYRSVVESLNEGILVVRDDGTILSCNPAAERILALAAEQIIGRDIADPAWQVIREDGGPLRVDLLPAVVALRTGREVLDQFLGIRVADGGTRWLSMTARPLLRGEGSGPHAVLVSFLDVTDRRRAELALRRSESQFRSLIEHAWDLTIVLDGTGAVRFAAPSVERMLGYEPREVVGRSVFDLLHPDEVEATRRTLALLLPTQGAGEPRRLRVRHRSGAWRLLEVVGTNLLGDPAVRGIVVNIRDVTQATAAERAVAESEERYRNLVELSPDAILVQRDGRITFVNPAGARLLGASSPEEVVGRDFLDLLAPEAQEHVRAAVEGHGPPPRELHETRYLRLDGTPVDVEVVAVPLDLEGPFASQAIIRDIGERKRAAAALERRDAILAAVAFAAERFLHARGGWREGIEEVLERLGRAAGADLAAIVEQRTGPDGATLARVAHRWQAPGAPAPLRGEDELIVPEWLVRTLFEQPGPLPVERLPQEIAARLREAGVEAALAAPIVVEGETWGVLVLSSARAGLAWQPIETDAVRAAADTLAAAIAGDLAAGHVQEAEARYRTLVEHVPVVAYTQPVAGVSGTYYISPQVERWLGHPASAWGDNAFWLGQIHPDDLERVAEADRRTDETGQPFAEEYRLRAADGSYRWIRDECVLVRDERGNPLAWQGVFADVTDRREAEEALRESETRYRALVEQAPDAIFVHAEGRLVFANSAGAALLGAGSPADLVGRSVLELTHPDDRAAVAGRPWALGEEGRLTLEERLLRLDGSVVEVEAVSIPVAHQGRPGFQTIMRDITERRRAERQLRESEASLAAAQAVAHMGSWEIDLIDLDRPLANPRRWSDEMFRLLGLEPGSVEPTEDLLYGRIPPEDRERVRRAITRAAREGAAARFRHRFVLPGGVERIVEVQADVLRDALGRPTMLVGNTVDVTDRVRAEEALREAEERYRQLVEQVPVVVYTQDVAGELRYVSPQIEAWFGYPAAQWTQGFLRSLIHPDDLTRAQEAGRRSGVTGMPFAQEYRMRAHDGRWLWVRDEAVMLPGEGDEPGVWQGVFVDVTERRRAEEELSRSLAELRRLDRERRRLIGRIVEAQEEERRRISDDIHDDSVQVMAAAAMRLQPLRREASDEQLEVIDRLESTINESIRRLRHLMFELRPPALDREGLAAAIRTYLTESAADTDLDFQVESDLPAEPPVSTRTIAYRIVQEALANVRKHANAERVQVRLSAADGGLLVHVVDDGVGFDPDEVGVERPGHVGFTAMRERAEVAGGRWQVESSPGNGTVVEFWIPPAGTVGGVPDDGDGGGDEQDEGRPSGPGDAPGLDEGTATPPNG